jgi:alkaline phosphatase D
MTFRIDRRTFVLTGTMGLAAFAIPGFARAFALGAAAGFTHNVASGEPGRNSVLLWTRYVPPGGDTAKLRVEVAGGPDFARIVAGGEMVTGPWRDHTAKITVDGLHPGTAYYYRFVAPDGSFSPVGRTRTLPEGHWRRWTSAIFSCSNLGFGHFNAYAHAAAREDIDLAIHMGDYLYEYRAGAYPSVEEAIASRVPLPANECLALADYRLRYASYRLDPDLQALHAAKPMIVQWDDHETANNSWEGGAENHGKDEGEWDARKAAAVQAFREWMPVSDAPWASYDIGTLATLYRTESRLHRSRGPDIAPLFFQPDPLKALTGFRDGEWQDPAATMLGSEQEAWLARTMASSVKAGHCWQVTGFGTIMGRTGAPPEALSWLKPDASARARAYVTAGVTAGKLGLPLDLDNWGGYPAARARFLKSAQSAGADLIVICGDSHNAWAYDLGQDGKPAGVEFAGHSVTSPGYEGSVAADAGTVAAALVARNPELKWCDTSHRGYMALTLTPDRATNEWVFVDTVRERSAKARAGHSATVVRGRKAMA